MPDIPIVYDHQDFLIINKPEPLAVQKEAEAEGVLPLIQRQTGLKKVWLVHRLDKVTSGLLILAKNQAAASYLSQLFSQRKISKYYLALSAKKPKKKQGLVSGDMRKIRDGVWLLEKKRQSPAITQFFSFGQSNGPRLFVVKPYTGKTHQIRVMMKSLGSPIEGDLSYKGNKADRIYLHAYKLIFDYRGDPISVSCLPQTGKHFVMPSFCDGLNAIGAPENLPWPSLKPGLRNLIEKSVGQYD